MTNPHSPLAQDSLEQSQAPELMPAISSGKIVVGSKSYPSRRPTEVISQRKEKNLSFSQHFLKVKAANDRKHDKAHDKASFAVDAKSREGEAKESISKLVEFPDRYPGFKTTQATKQQELQRSRI